jgi:hypothetical protein
MSTIANPIFDRFISQLGLVMNKMHKADTTVRSSRTNLSQEPNTNSVYLVEYLAKIKWVFREFISKLYVEKSGIEWIREFVERLVTLHLLHTCILPISNDTRFPS